MAEKNVIEVKNEQELREAAGKIQGPVVLEFADEKNCDACIADAPKVKAHAEKCDGSFTLLKVPVSLAGELPDGDKLADAYQAEALPSLFYAKSGAELLEKKVTALEDSAALKKLIKCSRK